MTNIHSTFHNNRAYLQPRHFERDGEVYRKYARIGLKGKKIVLLEKKASCFKKFLFALQILFGVIKTDFVSLYRYRANIFPSSRRDVERVKEKKALKKKLDEVHTDFNKFQKITKMELLALRGEMQKNHEAYQAYRKKDAMEIAQLKANLSKKSQAIKLRDGHFDFIINELNAICLRNGMSLAEDERDKVNLASK